MLQGLRSAAPFGSTVAGSGRVLGLGRPLAVRWRARASAARALDQPNAQAAFDQQQQRRQQQSCQQQQPGQQAPQLRPLASQAAQRLAAAAPAPLLMLALAGAARAEGEGPSYAYPAPNDPVVTVLFTLAIGLLSVVTLGVTYLGVLSFFDGRQEKKDRETGPPKTIAEQQEELKLKERESELETKRVRRVIDKSKGFGN